ncbi:collagen-binding domain-containing protein [Demequina flava]|uniref:collagen-binding domain-containing protein n=1 Tax=Demequina flava TaxID=1095025 RepID=UPI00078145A3|nr:collagen-binding domain-containing protein [Demequina flava]
MSVRTPAGRAAAVTAASVVATALVTIAAPQAAAETEGPLTGASQFTIVSETDVVLANHEIEGSIAAGGNLIAGAAAYNVVHRAAGSGDYTLPMLDGEYVRVVAGGTFDRESSTGSIRISPQESDPAKRGQVRLGSLDGLEVAARGDGVCVREVGDDGCPFGDRVLEQSATPQSLGSVEDADAYGTLIDAGAWDTFAQWSEALANGALAGAASIDLPAVAHPMNGVPLTLVSGAANVLDVDAAQLPSTGWKVRFDGAAPSTHTPLVINVHVDAGETVHLPTEAIGAYPQSSAHNEFASYILWNLVTEPGATVRVNSPGIVPGSILAPEATVITGPQKTLIEGQIVARRVELRNDGEIHHYEFAGVLSRAPVEISGSADDIAVDDESQVVVDAPAGEQSVQTPEAPSAEPVASATPEQVVSPNPEPVVSVSPLPIDNVNAAPTAPAEIPNPVADATPALGPVVEIVEESVAQSPLLPEIVDVVADGVDFGPVDSDPVPAETAPDPTQAVTEENFPAHVIEDIVAVIDQTPAADQLVEDVASEISDVVALASETPGVTQESVDSVVTAEVAAQVSSAVVARARAAGESQPRLAATGGVVDWRVGAVLLLVLAGITMVRRARRT